MDNDGIGHKKGTIAHRRQQKEGKKRKEKREKKKKKDDTKPLAISPPLMKEKG